MTQEQPWMNPIRELNDFLWQANPLALEKNAELELACQKAYKESLEITYSQ